MIAKTRLPLMLAAMLAATPVLAQDKALNQMSTQQRLERIERMLGADVLLEQAQQMDMMREEITSLRSIIEEQQYQMETVRQRQRSLYLDMDRRLMHLEAGAGNVGSSPIPPPNAATSVRTPTPAPVTAGKTRAPSGGAKADYDKAFELLKEGRYAQAIDAFSGFIAKHKGSQYMDNAQYWLAEANYVSREYDTALKEFNKLVTTYPDSTKIPGARLKIGYVYYELKDWKAARAELGQVVQLYPDTTVAKKAKERLARMKREGR